VHSNYEIDLFRNLIAAAAKATGTSDLASNSLRVIADHVRATSFLIADGVLPSNEGRGYVLRRIMRRAIRHGFMLGQRQPFFHSLVRTLEQEMGVAYPELTVQRTHIEKVILQEEERFAETLAQGMALLDTAIGTLGAGKRFRARRCSVSTTRTASGRPHQRHRARTRSRDRRAGVRGRDECAARNVACRQQVQR